MELSEAYQELKSFKIVGSIPGGKFVHAMITIIENHEAVILEMYDTIYDLEEEVKRLKRV